MNPVRVVSDLCGPPVQEFRAVVGVVGRYPRRFRTDDRRSAALLARQADGRARRNLPVVFVHGFGHNASAWLPLAKRLVAAEFVELHTVTYGIYDDVPAVGARIAKMVSTVLDQGTADRVHVVAHSYGGVAARYWFDLLGGCEIGDGIVTMGSPHVGTPWAALSRPWPIASDLVPDSAVLRAMNAADVPHDRWTTIGGQFDWVVPAARAHLQDSRRVDVASGHAGLLTSPTVSGTVCAALLEAEHERGTRRPGGDRQPVAASA